jgi:long-chain acyl-CoA synthetase
MPTVLHRLARWAAEDPRATAQRFKKDGEWRSITAGEFRDRVYHLALFFEAHGMTSNDVSAIFSPNCPQWVHANLAALLLGTKSAGLYPNSMAKDIAYVLNHTEARFLAVRDKEFFGKLKSEQGEFGMPDRVQLLLVFDGDTSISPKAIAYEAALAEGRKLAALPGAKTMDDYLKKIDPMASAFMIYTSGTTGNPKGALLTHDNLAFTSDLAVKTWNLPFAQGTLFSFLPLCHIAETLQNIGVGITQRYTVNFCTKFDNVAVELPEIQPTLLLCVPRLWEKMMEGVMHKVEKGTGAKKKLAVWALAVGERVAAAKYAGRMASPLDLIQLKIADKLVLSKVRHALGLGKADLLASGAAALPPHVSKWFRRLGLEILEDFGQTESTGVICMTQPGVESAGTVGKPVAGVEVKIADDGEMLARGRNVFKGYYKDEAGTAETLAGGWLHTGDLAEVDSRGLIRIRGRKKEVLKTSGGKMIAPLPIEEALKAAPIISQVCMVGDGRKYLSALVTLSEGTLGELKASGMLAKSSGNVITDESVVGQVRKYVDDLNAGLAGFEQIKRFAVLNHEFSIVDGEMTPTLKMKRNVIETRYRDVIDQMYA